MGLRPDFTVEAPAEHELDYIHRRTESEELYFVINSTDELVSWTELESEGARAFSGTARYTTTMQVPAAYLNGRHALQLDLGEVAEIAELSVNGTSIGIIWKPPFRAVVTGLLKAGANHLEVKVTNLWHNRIVGDLRFPEAGVHARTNLKHKFNADMELLPSGLLGPVVLRATVEVDMVV